MERSFMKADVRRLKPETCPMGAREPKAILKLEQAAGAKAPVAFCFTNKSRVIIIGFFTLHSFLLNCNMLQFLSGAVIGFAREVDRRLRLIGEDEQP